MAELKVKGDYVGPGEQKTAETLRNELPADWVIFAGRKLAGANRDDVDLIVVGKSVVFVLEEKAWGPRVVVDDNNWYVGEDRRLNPLNRVAQVSRKVAGLLREHVRGYRELRGRRVIPGVILSHDNLSLLGGQHHDYSENVLSLREATAALLRIDGEWDLGELGALATSHPGVSRRPSRSLGTSAHRRLLDRRSAGGCRPRAGVRGALRGRPASHSQVLPGLAASGPW